MDGKRRGCLVWGCGADLENVSGGSFSLDVGVHYPSLVCERTGDISIGRVGSISLTDA